MFILVTVGIKMVFYKPYNHNIILNYVMITEK